MKTKPLPINFTLVEIKVEQFALFPENFKSKKAVQMKTDLQFFLCNEEKSIRVVLGFTYEQQSKAFVKIEVGVIFRIMPEDFDKLKNVKEKQIVFPKDFMGHLTMLSIGTVRGILFAKTEGTEFSKFVLPTINVTEMITSDVVFEIEDYKL